MYTATPEYPEKNCKKFQQSSLWDVYPVMFSQRFFPKPSAHCGEGNEGQRELKSWDIFLESGSPASPTSLLEGIPGES